MLGFRRSEPPYCLISIWLFLWMNYGVYSDLYGRLLCSAYAFFVRVYTLSYSCSSASLIATKNENVVDELASSTA
jgi:hypothetical protein